MASYILSVIQRHLDTYVGHAAGEIILNSLLGGLAGFIGMKLARSSALIVGSGLIMIELISESGYMDFDRANTMERVRKTFSEWFSFDEFYRRVAQRGFLGGLLIGMSLS